MVTKFGLSPSLPKPRDWHRRCFQEFERVFESQKDFLVVATPGAGKTYAAAMMAHELLKRGQVERVVVVSPTSYLTEQWADAMTPWGIHLSPDLMETRDMVGLSVTYQQVMGGFDQHRSWCRYPTAVIFDEIHHCSPDKKWGEGIGKAFENAQFRIMLSGTPFRTDGSPIPFVRYENGICCPDIKYTYANALGDGVCRQFIFPSFEGTMEWEKAGAARRACFQDELPRGDASARLTAALDPEGGWLSKVVEEADFQVQECRRKGDKLAGGLILARDQEHARRIASLVRRKTGSAPVVVVSDDTGASDRIREFAEGSQTWLVSVKMVSEGVDIPRLRVVVYATNIDTELFFWQAVARAGRGRGDAYVFIPALSPLTDYAQAVQEERDHALREMEDESDQEEGLGNNGVARVEGDGGITVLGSSAEASTVFIAGEGFSPGEIEAVHGLVEGSGVDFQPVKLALQLRQMGFQFPEIVPRVVPDAEGRSRSLIPDGTAPVSRHRQRSQLGRLCAKWVSRAAHLRRCEYRVVNAEWLQKGNPDPKEATIEDLERKLAWLKDMCGQLEGRRCAA